MTKAKRMNLCTETLQIDPEAYGTNGLRQEYACVKNGYSVRACRYYRPMRAAGGLVCHEECHWFENGCTCKAARATAHRRTERILKNLLG